jgi:hypothetical protein
MENIKIEEVGEINFDFPYLEVFSKNNKDPFLEIGISDDRKLNFKFYASKDDVIINVEEFEYLLLQAKDFLEKAPNNKDIQFTR